MHGWVVILGAGLTHRNMGMRIKTINKILDVFVIVASLWFVFKATNLYFLLKTLSLEIFIIVTLFFSTCLLGSTLSLLGKTSSLKDIIEEKDRRIGDIMAGFVGLIFGIVGIYMGIFFEMDKAGKMFSIIAGLFFLITASIYLLIKIIETKTQKKGEGKTGNETRRY